MIGTIVIGFIVGVLARFLVPGKNGPRGLILTTILGIAGAVVATFLGQFFGFYKAGENAGFVGAVVGAIIVVYLWGFLARKNQA